MDQLNLLTVNLADSDVGHIKHCAQIYPSARLPFIISVSPTSRIFNSTDSTELLKFTAMKPGY